MSDVFSRARAAHDAPLRLLDEDPDLFSGLRDPAQRAAAGTVRAPRLSVPRGAWRPPAGRPGDLGLLVIDGMLLRSVTVGAHPRSEIVGAGDLIRPWAGEDGPIACTLEWDALTAVRLASLDGRVRDELCRWPEVMSALTDRALGRARWLALQLAITDLRRIEDRLLALLWHLADRWGRVGPDGPVVALPLTHEVLAQVVGAQRPTVTSGLRRLERRGDIHRRPDRSWVLATQPPRWAGDSGLVAAA